MTDSRSSPARLGLGGVVEIDAPVGRWRLEGRGELARLELLALRRREWSALLAWGFRLATGRPPQRGLEALAEWLDRAQLRLEVVHLSRPLVGIGPDARGSRRSRGFDRGRVRLHPTNLLLTLVTQLWNGAEPRARAGGTR